MPLRFSEMSHRPTELRDAAESGAVIVLASVTLVAVLLTLGLAIDAGNLYRSQLALQAAVDAAALSSVNHVNENIRTFPTEANGEMNQRLQPFAERSVYANLARTAVSHSAERPVSVGVAYAASEPSASNLFTLTVTAHRDVEYLLMNGLPGIPERFRVVSASATSERKIANVALLLDASGSMACPAVGLCTCLTAQRTEPCPQVGRKFDQLVDAVGEFIKLFHVERDRIVFVPFNRAASSLTLTELAQTLDENGVQLRHPVSNQQIDALKALMRERIQPTAETNICDALLRGRESLRGLTAGESLSMVLFSDGAPTAGRFLLSDVKSGAIEPWAAERRGQEVAGRYDYSHHAVEWVLPPAPNAPDIFPSFAGPSLLSQTGLFSPIETPPVPGAGLAACHNGDTPPPVNSEQGTVAASQSVFQPCINSLEFHMPYAPTKRYGSNYRPTPQPDTNQSFVEQYYNCAIATADFIRDDHGTIHAIGYGPVSEVADPLDPYADVRDGFNRKDLFNARVAVDLDSLLALRPDLAGQTVPAFPFTGYLSFDQELARNKSRQGTYLATGEIEEVRTLFQKMGRLILLRLVA